MKLATPLMHARTKKSIDAYLNRPAHALLLIGPEGIGKTYLANWLADQMDLPARLIEPEEGKKSISIDQIRNLYSQTKTGSGQIIILRQAHLMKNSAQNSFLKLLEEPPKNTYFILTCHKKTQLLPTIRSRCRVVDVLRPSKTELLAAADGQDLEKDSLYHTTDGLPGPFFNTLGSSDVMSRHDEIVATAKSFYSSGSYERHLILIKNSYDRRWAEQILKVMNIICEALLKARSDSPAALKKIIKQAELIDQTIISIGMNGSTKIHLTKLANLL